MRLKLIITILILITQNHIVLLAQSGNDNCSSTAILCANQALSGSNQNATTEICIGCADGATSTGICFELNNTVWYSFTTNATGGDVQLDFSNLVFDLSPGFGTALEAVIIQAGSPCNENTYTAVSSCATGIIGSTAVTATGLAANTTYYVQIDGSMSGADTDPASATFDLLLSGTAVDQTPPTVSLTSDANPIICVTENVTFTADTSGCNSSGIVEWFINGTSTSSGPANTFTSNGFTDGDQITAIYTCQSACPVSSVLSNAIPLTVDDPMAYAGNNIVIAPGETTTLQGSGNGTYLWGPSEGLSSTTLAKPIAGPDATTTYQLTVTSANGCVSVDEVTVIVDKPIFVPNTFTPNNDGFNDYWEISNMNRYPSAKVSVYDRWGQRIFNVVGYTNEKKWDGTHRGLKLPSATYFYVIDLQTGNDDGIYTGSITLIH